MKLLLVQGTSLFRVLHEVMHLTLGTSLLRKLKEHFIETFNQMGHLPPRGPKESNFPGTTLAW